MARLLKALCYNPGTQKSTGTTTMPPESQNQQSPTPPVAAPITPVSVQPMAAAEKKINNTGRSILAMGILYSLVSVLGIAALLGGGFTQDDIKAVISIITASLMSIYWIIAGISVKKSKHDIKKALKWMQITSILAFIMLFYYLITWLLLNAALNLGFILLVVFTVYLVVAQSSLWKLAKAQPVDPQITT